MPTARMRSDGLILLAGCVLLLSYDGVVAKQASPLMLANVFGDVTTLDYSDYWVSEKYDGIRAYWDGGQLLTRSGNRIHAPHWFVAGWPHEPLDGELWMGRGQFEAVSATVRDDQPDDAAWRKVRFLVFDLPQSTGPFTQRLQALNALLLKLSIPWVESVPQAKVADRSALEQKLSQIVVSGGEGVMLHRGSSWYRAERNDDLLKLKRYADAEARVIGHSSGNGKYTGMLGALQVERPDGLKFHLGTGFTDEQRRHPPPIGSWVTYSYNGLTANGIPRFARFMRIREDAPPLSKITPPDQ